MFAVMVVAWFAGGILAAPARAATPAWKLLAATGPTNLPTAATSERQTVALPPGTISFTLTFGGNTTAVLASDSEANDVEEALNALPSIAAGGGSVSVTTGETFAFNATGLTPYVVSFDGGPLAGTDVPPLSVSGGGIVQPTPSGTLLIAPTNVGGASTSGSYTVDVSLPAGVTTTYSASGNGWICAPGGGSDSSTSCSRASQVSPGTNVPYLRVPLTVTNAEEAKLLANISISGGGTSTGASFQAPVTISNAPAPPGIQAFWAGTFDENGSAETRAGAHPFSAGFLFMVNTNRAPATGKVIPAEDLRELRLDPAIGFLVNPLATERCIRYTARICPINTRIGYAFVDFGRLGGGTVGVASSTPLSNVLPPKGSAGQFSFTAGGLVVISTFAQVRPDDFGVTAVSRNLTPDDRAYTGGAFFFNKSPAASAAVLTNPTECSGALLETLLEADHWQSAGVFSSIVDSAPAVTACENVPFTPSMTTSLSSSTVDAASGLDFDLLLPQDGLLDPDGIAQSHVKDVTVDLPQGVSVNPSGATGLAGCSDAQMDVGTDTVPRCPEGSKIGSAKVTSPLVDRAVDGTLYLGTPQSTDPLSGKMLRLFLVVRNDDLGVMIKLPGSAIADPQTGQLTATFKNNPRLPFDHLSVALKGGERGVLATPQRCGPVSSSATLSPWSGTTPMAQATPLNVGGDCGFGFAPRLAAGMSTQRARGTGTFSFRFSRNDGEQWLRGLTAKLPTGLLASTKGLIGPHLCSDAQANAGNCPAASKIGIVDAAAGAGNPFVLEEKGEVFLTEGYKGGPYGLMVKVRAIAGPFRGDMELSPIIVRQAIHVDRKTAQVTAVSDPFPPIWHGVPLRVREVTVLVNRDRFMLNPSDCEPKQVQAAITSTEGTVANRSNPFQASGCAALPFKPKLALRLTGRKQTRTGKHPGIKAKVTQTGTSEAGIEKAVVRLPKSLALDPDNAQALCEFADGTKDDLENHCPKGSIVGRARAVSPLLNDPLVGNVYFVKNVRKDPRTGNEIRTLPMIIVALRGEIAVNLRGESDTTKSGKLVNTFASVPDAPISRFNLNIKGGKRGIIAVTRTRRAKINLCAGRHVAEADMDGHNGRRHDRDIRMKTPCSKRQTKKAKRAAKRAAKARKARS